MFLEIFSYLKFLYMRTENNFNSCHSIVVIVVVDKAIIIIVSLFQADIIRLNFSANIMIFPFSFA